MIKCHCCNSTLTGNFTHPERINPCYNYRCNQNRLNKTCSNNRSITERKLEKQLLDNLENYITNEIATVEAISEKKKPEIDNSNKIAAIKKEMNRLNTMFRKGRIEEDEYDKDFAALEADLATLEEVEKPKERDLTALKELLQSDWRTMYAALDKAHKRAFWRKLIKQFTVDENKNINPDSIIFF